MNQKQMIKQIRRKLTFVCAGITIGILIVTSFSYLYISEQSLNENQFLSFQNSVTSFLTNLEEQTVISHDWLVQFENDGSFYIELKDNGEDMLFNVRKESPFRNKLFSDANTYYETLNTQNTLMDNNSFHKEFSFTSSRKEYFGSSGFIKKEGGFLSFTIIYPLELLHSQIQKQRVLFCIIDVCTSLLLFLFSFYFIGKVMKPLNENHQKQTQFIASVSHELRTPLAVILSCASACQKADMEEKNGFLQTIHSEGVRMSRLIQDMLIVTKSDSHSFSIEKTPCEPETLLLNSFEAFELMAKEKELQFSITLPDELSSSCSLDQIRIMQVLAIIIHNAISYTPNNGRIQLSLCFNEKYLEYRISDTGVGIPDSEKDKIFQRFYRLSHARTEKEHFGLGLCIAAEIVHAHRGMIQVTDTPGGGTTFCIRLPRF